MIGWITEATDDFVGHSQVLIVCIEQIVHSTPVYYLWCHQTLAVWGETRANHLVVKAACVKK